MDDKVIMQLIREVSEAAAEAAVNKLAAEGRITYIHADSFRKTEELLRLHDKLPLDHPERIRIDTAISHLKDRDNVDIIRSRYFDGMTMAEIAEIYDAKITTISKRKNKMIRALARELFPKEMAKEIRE